MKCWPRLIFDAFFGDFWLQKNGGQREFYEAVANLFMKLQTLTVTELVNLGMKLEIILFQSRILCQFNSIFSDKLYIKKISQQVLVSWSDSVTRQLRNRLFWHQKHPKFTGENHHLFEPKKRKSNSVKSGHSVAFRKNPG